MRLTIDYQCPELTTYSIRSFDGREIWAIPSAKSECSGHLGGGGDSERASTAADGPTSAYAPASASVTPAGVSTFTTVSASPSIASTTSTSTFRTITISITNSERAGSKTAFRFRRSRHSQLWQVTSTCANGIEAATRTAEHTDQIHACQGSGESAEQQLSIHW